MGKRKRKPIEESAVKAVVRTPMFRMRVAKDKTKYMRKPKDNGMSYKSEYKPNESLFGLFGLYSVLVTHV